MKRITISIIHIIIVTLTFLSVLKGGFPRVYDRPEIIPYKLVPSHGERDILMIEIIEPNCLVGIPEVQKEETIELIFQRIKLQENYCKSLYRLDDYYTPYAFSFMSCFCL